MKKPNIAHPVLKVMIIIIVITWMSLDERTWKLCKYELAVCIYQWEKKN